MSTPTAEDRMQKAIALVLTTIVCLLLFVGWGVLKLARVI